MKAASSSGSSMMPTPGDAAGTTNAIGTSSRTGSGAPTTTASSTAGCSVSALSTSTTDTFSPDTLSTSARRPSKRNRPSSSRHARSPVTNHPSRNDARRRRGVVEVLAEQLDAGATTHNDLADLTGPARSTIGIDDVDRASGGHVTHRVRAWIVRAIAEHGGNRLGHSVQLTGSTSEPRRRGSRTGRLASSGRTNSDAAAATARVGPAAPGRPSPRPPRARIIRIGPANRLACVAPWRAACSTKPLAGERVHQCHSRADGDR